MCPDKNTRYFFDLNKFDEPDAPEIDPDAPPPPPVFSLEEMIEARDHSFEDGRNTGLEHARQSREQYIAEQIHGIRQQFETLIHAEHHRDTIFEQEVIALCREIFAKAFPALNQREGMNEILSVIHSVLQQHATPGVIQIAVPPDETEEISARLHVIAQAIDGFDPSRLQIDASPDLQRGSCRVRWKDGSAQRHHGMLADAIKTALDKSAAPSIHDTSHHASHDSPLAPDAIKSQDTL